MKTEKSFLHYIPLMVGILLTSFLFSFYLFIPYLLPELLSALSGKVTPLLSMAIYLLAIFTLLKKLIFGSKLKSNLEFPVIFSLAVYIILGTLVNVIVSSVDYSRWGFVFISLPLLFLIVSSYTHSEGMAERIMVGTVLMGAAVTILMTFSDAAGNFPSLSGVIHHRGSVYFLGIRQGPVTLASISGLSLITAIMLMLTNPQKWLFRLLLPTLPFLMIALVFSGGRMAILAAIFTMIIAWFFRKEIAFSAQTARYLVLIAAVSLFIIVPLVVWMASQFNVTALERIMSIPTTIAAYSTDQSISDRFELWTLALTTLKKYPLGIGFDSFFATYGLSTHNEFINIALGTGIFGLITYLVMGTILYYHCYLGAKFNNTAKNRALALTAFCSGIFMFFTSFTEAWSYSNTIVSVMIWIILAVGVSVSHNTNRV